MASAITRNTDFAGLLNEYCPNSMLTEEVVAKDYVWNKCKKDLNAYGSKVIVPFYAAGPTSVRFGKLTAEADVSSCIPVRGELEAMVEVYATLKFNHADLVDQAGRIPESTFMKVFPGEVAKLTKYTREVTSQQMLNGSYFATVTDATNAATGIMLVDHPERFQLGQKCEIDDDNSSALVVYVIGVDYNTRAVTFSAARGSTAANISAYSVAQNARFYHDGVLDQGTFNSFRSALLSLANGGSTNLHGKAKTAYGSFLQAMNISGSDITASNILEKLFDAWITCKTYGKCTADTVLCNMRHMGSIMKLMEDSKGQYSMIKSDSKAMYGYWETEIVASKTGQTLKIVGLQEMDFDIIPIVNFSDIVIRSKGGLKKIKQPDGAEFYSVRAETGFSYLIDLELHAQLEFDKPGENAILHTISY